MTLIGWALGLLLGFVLGGVQVRLADRWAQAAAGLGWLILAALLVASLTADAFTQGFAFVSLTIGAVLSVLAAVPRLLLRTRRPEEAEGLWVSLGLGAALTASVPLTGLGADALLTRILPAEAKAQASSGLVPGLLLGTVLGLGWSWIRARRTPAALP